jgi:hypothetical protein
MVSPGDPTSLPTIDGYVCAFFYMLAGSWLLATYRHEARGKIITLTIGKKVKKKKKKHIMYRLICRIYRLSNL